MSERDDPRWLEVEAFLKWVRGTKEGDRAGQGFLDKLQRCMTAFESIANDPTAPPEYRGVAQKILADASAYCREHTGEALTALGKATVSADEDKRAAAEKRQGVALVRVRDVIDDPATPEEIRQQAIEQRRKFLAS